MGKKNNPQLENSPVSVKYKRGENPNSQKNLKPFPKGSQGNPRSGYSLTAALKDALGDKKRRKELIASTIEGAIKREPTPFREVWDRVEGKLQDTLPKGLQDNRVVNIFVVDKETEGLIAKVKERTGKLIEG